LGGKELQRAKELNEGQKKNCVAEKKEKKGKIRPKEKRNRNVEKTS